MSQKHEPNLKREFRRISFYGNTIADFERWAALGYRLRNRYALEWILDQYKEKKPKDPTIRAKFDTYRFADYKEKVIDLLMRVTTVSVETMRIVNDMATQKR